MILTNTYAVKESSLGMYNPRGTVTSMTPSMSPHSLQHGSSQLLAGNLLHPTWAKTPMAALEQLCHFWVFNQPWTVIF